MIKINSFRRNEHEKNIKDAYKKSISIYDEILVGKNGGVNYTYLLFGAE